MDVKWRLSKKRRQMKSLSKLATTMISTMLLLIKPKQLSKSIKRT
jgi:hypothetical protein